MHSLLYYETRTPSYDPELRAYAAVPAWRFSRLRFVRRRARAAKPCAAAPC